MFFCHLLVKRSRMANFLIPKFHYFQAIFLWARQWILSHGRRQWNERHIQGRSSQRLPTFEHSYHRGTPECDDMGFFGNLMPFLRAIVSKLNEDPLQNLFVP